jgi:large subunit ribosomal protein L18
MIKKIKSVKVAKRLRLHKKIRSQVNGTAERPRLCVFKSNIYIYAQLINDDTATTICAANDMKLGKMTKMECAVSVGKTIAELAKKAGVNTVVFDRAGFKYGGRVKALAEAARESGLIF